MKSASLVLLFVIVGAWAADQSLMPDPSWARPIEKSSSTSKKAKADNDMCDAVYSCSDCKTARVCKPTNVVGQFELVQEMACPDERPFCDPTSGTCVSDAPGNCGEPDDFICMGNGRYPDPDCTKFHVCIDLVSKTFECAVEGHRYNALTQTCEDSTSCGTFDCSSNQVRKAPHDVHPGFFAYCNVDSKGALVVDSCPPHYKLDISSQNCEPDCKENGIIADYQDCHSYYKCTSINLRKDVSFMSVKKMQCPDGQAYSQEDFLCVDQDKVKTCPK